MTNELTVLSFMAMYCEPITMTSLMQEMRQHELRTKRGTHFNIKEIKEILRKLVDSDKVARDRNGYYRYVGSFQDSAELVDAALEYDEFYKTATRLATVNPRDMFSFYFNSSNSYQKAMRYIKMGLHLGIEETLEAGYRLLARSGDSEAEKDYINLFFTEPHFQERRLSKTPVEFQLGIIDNMVSVKFGNYEKIDKELAYCKRLLGKVKLGEHRQLVAILIANIELCQGNVEVIESMSSKVLGQSIKLISSFLSIMKGDFQQAVNFYEALIADKGTKQLGGNLDVLYVWSAMMEPSVDMEPIKQYVAEASRKNQIEETVDVLLDILAIYWSGEVGLAKELLVESTNEEFSPFIEIVYYYLHYWLNPSQIDIQCLTRKATLTYNNNYKWMALHLNAILSALEPNLDVPKNRYETLKKELNLPLFLDAYQSQADWEIVLGAMATLTDNNKSTNTKERIAWLVDFEENEYEPRLQKIKKNGDWSKGRRYALEKLVNGYDSCTTKQDIQMGNTLLWLRETGRQYYADNSDYINFYRAAIGHPYLFLSKTSSQVAVDLSEAEPELFVQETSTGLSVSLPEMYVKVDEPGVNIVKETPTRYKVVNITAELIRLAKMVGRNFEVPVEGKEQLMERLQQIGAIVNVQSSLNELIEDVAEVPNDTRIYAHLLPVGDGFHIEFFVKPLGEEPPYYKPADGGQVVFGEIDGQRVQTKRDLKAEKKLAKSIRDDIEVLKENRPKKGIWILEDAEQCLGVLRGLDEARKEDKVVIEWPKGEKIKIKHYASLSNFSVSVRSKGDWFELDGELKLGEDLVYSMQEILGMIKGKKSEFVELADGQFLALTKHFKKQLKALENIADVGKNGIRINPLASTFLEDWEGELADFEVDQAWKERIDKLKTTRDKTYKLPKDLNAKLRPYQKEGYEWLSRLADWGVGACLADDMGLGKTLQALAVILNRAKEGPALVVAPASVCRNWVKEAQKFAPALQPYFFNEEGREELLKDPSGYDVIIVTYGLMQTTIGAFQEINFSTIVLDEAQAIKNKDAKRTRAAMQLQGGFKIITTGTPIENHLGELWSLFNFINPGLLGSLDRFNEKFAIPIERYYDEDAKASLKRLVQPFILRRLKKNVLKDLPEKTEIVLDVNMSKEELAFYEALRRNAVSSLESLEEENGPPQHLKILAEIMRLRQSCCHPKLVEKNINLKSSKLELLGETLDELIENEHKVLIFSQFVGYLKLIEEFIKDRGITYQYLDGSTPTKKRQERIDAFQDGEGDIFLISLKAGGTGLNLTAADYVIHMDPWWNPAVEDQASDRAHRIGQQRPVTVYRLVTQNTIEEKIIKLHEQKRDLADSLLSGSDVSAKLSAKDLLNLIKEG